MITTGKAVQPAQHHCNDCHNTTHATASVMAVDVSEENGGRYANRI